MVSVGDVRRCKRERGGLGADGVHSADDVVLTSSFESFELVQPR